MMRTLLSLLSLAVAVAPLTAAHAGGSVKVSSDLVGMSIIIDGNDTGLTTPATVGNLEPGRHEVRVRGDCRVGAVMVEITDGGTETIRVNSSEGRGQLTVVPTPPVSTVAIDGEPVSGPSVLACGEHTVVVNHPGYLQAIVRVSVDADERRELPVVLETLGTATLVVDVTPADAKLLLDGRVIGFGPLTDDKVPTGPHILEAQADGYAPASKQFILDQGGTESVSFTLEPTAAVAAVGPTGSAPADSTPSAGGSGGGRVSPLKATGIGLTAVGVGASIFAITRFSGAAGAYEEYTTRSQIGPGPQSEVDAIRTDEVVPLRNSGLVFTGLGAAMLASGVTLVVAF